MLDTNTVLAWWWFRDPAVAALGAAVESGVVAWIASRAMRQELAAVLHHGLPSPGIGATTDAVLEAFDQYARQVPEAGGVHHLHCTDRSDQIFIDLAIGHRVQWLFSRDRAVLKLRRRALPWGVSIVQPDSWHGIGAERNQP